MPPEIPTYGWISFWGTLITYNLRKREAVLEMYSENLKKSNS